MSGFQRVFFNLTSHLSKLSGGFPDSKQLLLHVLQVIYCLTSRRLHSTVHRRVTQPTSDTTCTSLLFGNEGGDTFAISHPSCHESISSLVKFVLDILNGSVTERQDSDRCARIHQNVSDNIKYGLRFSSSRRAINNTDSMRKRPLYRNLLILVALKRQNNWRPSFRCLKVDSLHVRKQRAARMDILDRLKCWTSRIISSQHECGFFPILKDVSTTYRGRGRH